MQLADEYPMKPLAIDLFCGLGGWSDGLLAEGWDVIGFDIERHEYGEHRYPGLLAIQDVLPLHGSQFKTAALIVASPPCQAYSYRAMPWKRAKALPPPDNTLFEACFRIQREACEAAGRHIPLVVENVRGAQKWVGRARWHYGSFYLWGDVPALMPPAFKARKFNPDGTAHPPGSWFAVADSKNRGAKVPGFRFDGSGRSFQSASVEHSGIKGVPHRTKGHWTNPAEHEGFKRPGINLSDVGFNVANANQFKHMVEGVKIERSAEDKRQHIGTSRKFASAMIAKIPLPLSRHIAAVFKPTQHRVDGTTVLRVSA